MAVVQAFAVLRRSAWTKSIKIGFSLFGSFSFWDSSVFLLLHFSLSLTKFPHLCICKCFHMKSTSGAVRLFVHLVLGVGTKPVLHSIMKTHCCLSTTECLQLSAHLCASPIIYKAVITVVNSKVAELNCHNEEKHILMYNVVSILLPCSDQLSYSL